MPFARTLACLLVCAIASPVSAQSDPVSGQWQPNTEENAKLQEDAESNFKEAMKNLPQARQESGAGYGQRGNRGGSREGGRGGGGRGPGAGRQRNGRGAGESKPLSFKELLPARLNFAAPLRDTLVLYRTREAVLFGSRESDRVTIVPISQSVDLGGGYYATISEDAGQLVLRVDVFSTRRVYFRYFEPSAASAPLNVEISFEGGVADASVSVKRVYQRAPM